MRLITDDESAFFDEKATSSAGTSSLQMSSPTSSGSPAASSTRSSPAAPPTASATAARKAAEMEPGDVLLHHVKVLHGSDINRSSDLRRVGYFDNRAKSWNDHYAWFKPEFIEKRARLYQHALHVRSANPTPATTPSSTTSARRTSPPGVRKSPSISTPQETDLAPNLLGRP